MRNAGWMALLAAVLLYIPLAAQEGGALPDGDGKELVETVCTQCHGLDSVTGYRRSTEEWKSVVNDMVSRGAPLFEDEVEAVAQYLGKNFGPAAEGDSKAAAGKASE